MLEALFTAAAPTLPARAAARQSPGAAESGDADFDAALAAFDDLDADGGAAVSSDAAVILPQGAPYDQTADAIELWFGGLTLGPWHDQAAGADVPGEPTEPAPGREPDGDSVSPRRAAYAGDESKPAATHHTPAAMLPAEALEHSAAPAGAAAFEGHGGEGANHSPHAPGGPMFVGAAPLRQAAGPWQAADPTLTSGSGDTVAGDEVAAAPAEGPTRQAADGTSSAGPRADGDEVSADSARPHDRSRAAWASVSRVPEHATPMASGRAGQALETALGGKVTPVSNEAAVSRREPSSPEAARQSQIPIDQFPAATAVEDGDLHESGGQSSDPNRSWHAADTKPLEPASSARSTELPPVAAVATSFASEAIAALSRNEHAEAAAAPRPDAENLTRLIQTMRVQLRQGLSEATLRLRPEHLGEVTIAVRLDGSTVSAVVHAETAAVRQWLQSNEETLRNSLAEQGLHLGRFVVDRDRQERRDQHQPNPRPTRVRPSNVTGATRFEITV